MLMLFSAFEFLLAFRQRVHIWLDNHVGQGIMAYFCHT